MSGFSDRAVALVLLLLGVGLLTGNVVGGGAADRAVLPTLGGAFAAEPLPEGCPPATATVGVDHEAALTELLTHLAERGARRPALVAPPLNSSWARQLHRAYDAWCREGSSSAWCTWRS